MAKIKVKGTTLKQNLGGVYTAVAQLTTLNVSGAETETVESDTLDNTDAGIEYDPTGRSEGGSVDGDLLYDPALGGHQNITDLITTPAKEDWQVVYADSAETTAGFTSAGVGFDITMDQGDLVRASFSLKLDGILSYPT